MSPRPKKNEKRVSAYVSEELTVQLKEEADKKGINVSTLIRMILHEYMNTQKEKG